MEKKQVDPITEGPYKGWFRAALHFVAVVGGKAIRFSLELFTRNEAIAQEVLDNIIARIHARAPNGRMDLAHIVQVSTREMRRKYHLSSDDLHARIKHQFGDVRIGLLQSGRDLACRA